MPKMPLPHLLTGQVLYGYCGGWFGRDSYANKRIEAIGIDWVVAREGEDVVFASGDDIHQELMEYTDREKHGGEDDG